MLDPRYIIASDLESYFVDKDSGLPLSGGQIFFYSDVNRSTLKPIYTLSESAPNYSYTQLPNPSTLSGVGTFQDGSNNNVVPYYFPYDADGNIELYYIEVYNSEGVQQFTREAWPNIAAENEGAQTNGIENFIPNGQFLAHNNIPYDPINKIPAGQITQGITNIAPGGWTFERPSPTTSVDNVSFFRFPEYVSNPTASPRFDCRIICSSPNSADSFKDLRINFGDVNKFSSDTDEYTFAFTASTFSSGNFTLNLNLIKNYGTGGSPAATTITTLTTFNITSTPQIFSFAFSFGANTGNPIGNNDDDFVALALSFPTNISFGIDVTDGVLFPGDVNIEAFPPTTNKDFIIRSLSPETPDHNGLDLYCPIINTQKGFTYDHSQIGKIYASLDPDMTSLSPTTNEMLLDGSSYPTNGYSPLGIPFSRLQSLFYDSSTQQNIFGTGPLFVESVPISGSSSTPYIKLFTNVIGVTTHPTDGAIPTGFTFSPICNGSSTGYQLDAYQNSSSLSSSSLVAFSNNNNPTMGVDDPDPGNSGFTIIVLNNTSSVASKLEFELTSTVSASTLTSKYFTFETNIGNYYCWFTVDGAGTDPAPGGTGIRVNLLSTFTISELIICIQNAISGFQGDYIYTVAGSSITPGSYFNFTSVSPNNFYAWYRVNNVGVDPNVAGRIGIRIDILSTDTALQVVQKTNVALNMAYYKVPDFRGLFLRGYDPTKNWDLDADDRFGLTAGFFGNKLGTFELSQFIAHSHGIFQGTTTTPSTSRPISSVSLQYIPVTTLEQGGTETRSVNANVNWIIKY